MHSDLHLLNIKKMKDKLFAAERGQIKLGQRQIAGLRKAIILCEQMTIEKQPIQKRIPLHRRGELWCCGNCL
jgi:hypothetical protein